MSHRFFRPLIAFFSLTLALGPALLGQPAYTPYHFKIVATTLKGTYADGPATVARFNAPVAVAMDLRGNLIIADRDNHAIRQISPEGNVTTLAGLAGHAGSADGAGANARFNKPVSVAVDPSGNILVADSGNYTVRRITPQGIVSTLAGLAGTAGHVDGSAGVARFTGPQTVATDPAGNVWVADFQPIPSYTPGT
ncbi:MAG: hypothetical protein JSS11_10635, partial [Verrucomicrobia bacterium]|nr:hypothetical protein [Verrucomicrobiota bacterium]